MRKLLLSLLLSLVLLLIVGALLSSAAPPTFSTTTATATLRTLNSGHHFLPPYPNPRDRFGFDSISSDPLTNYDVAQLNAGWYSDWAARSNPAHPDGLTYVQLLRVKAGSDPHDPAQVTVSPNQSTIANIAAAHPGSLWMVGNEPDSLYQGTPIYPDVYAHVYSATYHYIKGLDPTALIANGAIVQPTPCRMAYLDIVWDTYYQTYSETMPVDVWNIHAFILREVYGSWGASTPPGVDRSCAMDYRIRDGDDVSIFRDNLITFRQWMKDKGEQNKPLVISEYGILWPSWLNDEDGNGWPPTRVSHFMTQTFDLFLTETFTDVGYPEDDYRLVQTWAWYSLSEDQNYNGYLFRSGNHSITQMGLAFANYTAALTETPYADLTIHHDATLDTSPLQHITLGDPYESTSVTLPVWVHVANLGNVTATNVPLVADTPYAVTNTLTLPPRYTTNVASFSAPIVLTQPGLYNLGPDLRIVVGNTTNDPRPWNNVATETMSVTIDARPDLVISTTTWSVYPSETSSSFLNITLTVSNEGIWPASPVSGTLALSDTHGSLLVPDHRFSIPAIEFGSQAIVTAELILPNPLCDIYHLLIEADSDGVLDEANEDNNRSEIEVNILPDLLVSVTDWGVRSSGTPSSTLNVTFTVFNAGAQLARPVSGTRYLSNTYGTLLLSAYRFPIPAIPAWGQVTITQETILPSLPGEDFYRLLLDVDSDGILDEQNEDNNQGEAMIPIVVTTTLEPGSAGVLTSASGHITFQFITGTVATSLELCFVPLWLPALPPGPPRHAEAFRLTPCQGQQAVSPTLLLPVTVTWQYTSADVAGMDEDELDLYRWTESERWQRVSCLAEQRWVDENRLSTCIQQLGEYVFGYTYKQNLPFVLFDSEGNGSAMCPKAQPEIQKTQQAKPDVLPASPLRLPPSVPSP